MTTPLHESIDLTKATAAADRRSGRMTLQVLTPGWGTSGYYSPEVCESGAELVAVGTHMYLDHPAADGSGVDIHGNRSVRDIAAVVTEAGRWDPETQSVIAECQVTAPYREFLADEHLAPHLGLSIRGSATDATVGEADGRQGTIIEGLHAITSVDFVTRAGRGGRVLQVLESARPAAVIDRAIGHGVAEATADERRDQLADTVRDTYGGENVYAYVRDFDETTVWFVASAEDEASKTWQQAYTVADDDLTVALTGQRTEVRAVTKYVPAARPDNPTTEESQEGTMGKIQVEESEHRTLTEKAGRVEALEAENATLKADNIQLQEADARRVRTARATEIISARAAEAQVGFTVLEARGLLAELPLTEAGALDETTFTTAVDEAAATKKTAAGGGQVIGFGGTVTNPALQESADPWADIDSILGIEQKGA